MGRLLLSSVALCALFMGSAKAGKEPYDLDHMEGLVPYSKGFLYLDRAETESGNNPHIASFLKREAFRYFIDDQSPEGKLQALLLLIEGTQDPRLPKKRTTPEKLFHSLDADIQVLERKDFESYQSDWASHPDWRYVNIAMNLEASLHPSDFQISEEQLNANVQALIQNCRGGHTPSIEWLSNSSFESEQDIPAFVALNSFRDSPKFLRLAKEHGQSNAKRYVAIMHFQDLLGEVKNNPQMPEERDREIKESLSENVKPVLLDCARQGDTVALGFLVMDVTESFSFMDLDPSEILFLCEDHLRRTSDPEAQILLHKQAQDIALVAKDRRAFLYHKLRGNTLALTQAFPLSPKGWGKMQRGINAEVQGFMSTTPEVAKTHYLEAYAFYDAIDSFAAYMRRATLVFSHPDTFDASTLTVVRDITNPLLVRALQNEKDADGIFTSEDYNFIMFKQIFNQLSRGLSHPSSTFPLALKFEDFANTNRYLESCLETYHPAAMDFFLSLEAVAYKLKNIHFFGDLKGKYDDPSWAPAFLLSGKAKAYREAFDAYKKFQKTRTLTPLRTAIVELQKSASGPHKGAENFLSKLKDQAPHVITHPNFIGGAPTEDHMILLDRLKVWYGEDKKTFGPIYSHGLFLRYVHLFDLFEEERYGEVKTALEPLTSPQKHPYPPAYILRAKFFQRGLEGMPKSTEIADICLRHAACQMKNVQYVTSQFLSKNEKETVSTTTASLRKYFKELDAETASSATLPPKPPAQD